MVISDDILEAAHLSEAEVRLEIALALFAQDRLSLSQAARLANLSQSDFQSHLPARKIPVSLTALFSETALAADWNRPEEDEAWSHLHPDS